MKNKILALLTAMLLCVELFPLAVLAQGDAETDEIMTGSETEVTLETELEDGTGDETEVFLQTESEDGTGDKTAIETGDTVVESSENADGEEGDEANETNEVNEVNEVNDAADDADNEIVPMSTIAGGDCGKDGADNLMWEFDNEGTLTITGAGAMQDFASSDAVPWKAYAGNIGTIEFFDDFYKESGATNIGNYAFASCTGLSTVTLPDDLTAIGEYAFDNCMLLIEADVPEGGDQHRRQRICGLHRDVHPETAKQLDHDRRRGLFQLLSFDRHCLAGRSGKDRE